MNSALLARAAASGMLLGAVVACSGQTAEPAKNPQAVSIPAESEEPGSATRAEDPPPPAREKQSDPNCCAGKNECKGLGGCAVASKNACAGKNECKGKGGCKSRNCPTAEPRAGNCCKGMNECKGKGGCKTDKNDCAGKNECKGQGGCNAFCPR